MLPGCMQCRFLTVILMLLLVACGGEGTDPQPPAVNQAPVAHIVAPAGAGVQLPLVLDGSTSSDPEGMALHYAWTLLGAPAGSVVTLINPHQAQLTLTPDKPGEYHFGLVVSDGVLESAMEHITLTAVAPAIRLSQPEPVSGVVQLSLDGVYRGNVEWYLDTRLFSSSPAAGSPLSWTVAQLGNGAHQLLAKIFVPGSTASTDIRRTVMVDNPSVSLTATVSSKTGLINVDVRASSRYGITAVRGALDGGDDMVLAAPNACAGSCNVANDIYRFVLDAAKVGSGSHVMQVVATDGSGYSRQLQVAVPVSNAPQVQITKPVGGALLYGDLQLTGSATSDKSGPITIKAMLGDITFLETTTTASFSGHLDLTGMAPGSYTLTVLAIDSTQQDMVLQRQVIVVSSPQMVVAPAFQLPDGARMLALEAGQLLYDRGDGVMLLRDLADDSEVGLAQSGSIRYADDWQLSGGRVYTYGKGDDCSGYCIYEWTADGSMHNLSLNGRYYGEHPVAHDGWVIWSSLYSASYILYNVTHDAYTQINMPAMAGYQGNFAYDFSVVNGVVYFYFWAQTGGEGTASLFDIFEWRSDTSVFRRLTQGKRNYYVKTDGQRVAWLQSEQDGTGVTTAVWPFAGGGVVTMGSAVGVNSIKDGVLVWSEGVDSDRRLSVSPQGGGLIVLPGARLAALSGGHVFYIRDGRVYDWNTESGVTRTAFNVLPQLLCHQKECLYQYDTAVYRLSLY